MKRKLPQLQLALAFVSLIVLAASVKAQKETLPDLIRRVKPSVVSVVTYNAKGEALTSGSGFFVRPGQVVTNLHVIDGAHHAEVRTFDGKGRVYPVQGMLDVDDEGDLAILSLNVPQDRARSLDLSPTIPEEGESIFVIGNPLRLEGSISDGIVSAVREVPDLGKIIQITAPISHGNSGSPLFNMKGQVVGVVTMKIVNGQNINLALSASRVMQLQPGKLMTFDEMAGRNRTGAQTEALAEWWYRNGLNSLWLGNYDSALVNFENAVNRNPARAEAWIQVGYCKVKQGKNEDAITAYQKAIRLRPNSAEAYNKLGDAYYYAERFTEAITAYKEAARLQPRFAEAYYNLGMAYLEVGDRVSAVAQGCLLQPLDTELYRKLMAEIQR
jgi:tetratricopeptide (TPR) repeat protein